MNRIAMFFTAVMLASLTSGLLADDWNQWLGPNRDSVWNESGILKSIPKEGLKEVWRQPVGSGFSGPAVVGDRVFVTDYLLKSGDARFDPGKRSQLKGRERVHCLDRKTGKTIWQKSYDCPYSISYAAGPRATPTVDGDKVYTLGAEGHLNCFNVADGEIVWQKDLKQAYNVAEAPIWGYAAHPLVVGDMLICMVGGEGSVAVAFDKNSGKEIWKSLTEKDLGYCPPTLINAGGTDQLLIWHAQALNSLNPISGELYWSVKMAPAYAMSIVAPIHHGEHLLVTALSGGSALLKLNSDKPGASVVWRGKGLHPDHNPPIVHEGHIYGVDVKGRLRCIEMIPGKRIWENLATAPNGRPASSTTGFVVRNKDHWYITTELGELIIAKMSPQGFEELGRAKMLEPTAETSGRKIVWSHPAFSHKCIFARNDKEIVCYSLAE
ncbi:MAG: outer membrane protein assembly factor BamB [Mariniblastus sp.]|jgi:hypothetical protein